MAVVETMFNFLFFNFLFVGIEATYPPISPSWYPAYTLRNNVTVIGWNDDNYQLSTSYPSLCLSIDKHPALHCIKTRDSYQILPFTLSPGEHFLHIAKDMSQTPKEVRIYVEPFQEADGLKVLILSPAFGTNIELNDGSKHIAKTKLEVYFNVIDSSNMFQEKSGLLPPGAMMVIGLHGQSEFIVSEQTNNFVLSGIEPGTHRISAQVVESITRNPLGSPVELVFEAIFSPTLLTRHQYTFDRQAHSVSLGQADSTKNTVVGDIEKMSQSTRPSSIKTMLSSLFGAEVNPLARVKSIPLPHQPAQASIKRKIRLTFVGSLKYDGQRAIWLHQMHYFKKEEFDITMVTYTRDNMDKAVLDFLKEYDIKLIVAPFPPVGVEEIAHSLADHYNQYVKSRRSPQDMRNFPFWLQEARAKSGISGDLTETELFSIIPTTGEALNYYLLGFLKEAGGKMENITLKWVANVWQHCVSTLQHTHGENTRGDLLIFANARDSSDAFLAEAARLSGTSKVVIDLPNLFPDPELRVDVMVAPSHYVKHHPSVTPFHNNTKVVVINPGVDVDVFHPKPRPINTSVHTSKQGTVPVIGFLARFAPEKSPGLFLCAAKVILSHWPFAKFVIIGAGSLDLKGLVERLGIGGSVLFKGGIYDAPLLASEVRSMTVVVNPSLRAWSETFCIANIEVMAAGVPVVSFGIGGIKEYLRSDYGSTPQKAPQNGIIVKEATSHALAEGVLYLLANRTRREEMIKVAQQEVLENFSIKREVAAYRDLYVSLLNGDEITPI